MLRRRKNNERGAAAVEFALISTILLALLISIIQLSIFFWAHQSASAAAREAARFAAVQPCDNAAIIARGQVRMDETAPVADGASTVTVETPLPDNIGDDITVRVVATTTNFGLIPGFTGAIDKQATARVENIPGGDCTP